MGYVSKCTSCNGSGQWYDDTPCPKCGGSGAVKPYRVNPTYEDDHWRDVQINTYPDYGRDGFCTGCGKPVEKPRKRWCGSRWCKLAHHNRLYAGVHWTKRHVCVRDGCACKSCGEIFEKPLYEGGPPLPCLGSLELDHIVPLHRGGTDAPDNLQLLCSPCHKEKTIREKKP